MSILKILISAFWNTKNIYRSIVGDKVIENIKNNKTSEFNKNNWTLFSLLYFFYNIFFPRLPITSPSWIPNIIKRIFFGSNSKYIPDDEETDNGIFVLYINGIMSNEKIIIQNKKLLNNIFNRKINLIHNVTDSIIIDLIECLIGKQTDDMSEAAIVTLYTLCKKLLDPNIKKIIIICHSQGTIIVGKVLQNLSKLGLDKEEYIKKIEIYAFANCSSNMTHINNSFPYIESFANENDFVARLGCNCTSDIKKYIKIDGIIFIKKNKSGHMFNTHYINNFSEDFPNSRLNIYINK